MIVGLSWYFHDISELTTNFANVKRMHDFQLIIEDLEDVEDVRNVRQMRERRPKVYLEHMNPFEKYNDEEFKKIYRFHKQTLQRVIDMIREEIVPMQGNIGSSVSPEIQVLSTIRYLAKGNYQSESAHLHGFSQATMSRILKRVVTAIAGKINEFIYFPRSNAEILETKQGFYAVANLPNIVGAIDCTHIKIKNPGGNYPALFINRKGFFSLNVQVVCDSEARIRDIVARWRGSVHDSRIWNNCNLHERFEAGDITGILIGDNGYPNKRYLLTPLLHPNTPQEQRYNEAHIKTRNVIERLFGQWKNKFRCFFNGMQMDLETAKITIIALAILHNIAVQERLEINAIDSDSDASIEEEENENAGVLEENEDGNLFRANYIRNNFH